ncbi:hypothetical protein HNR23_004661 [Nocardiopsis mwathae]|uniref:Guanylate cyclase domain-containing protein n=1 Tax=Nocardiopsis mwathae TaxID=1472723 RepID=A0A7W9YN52_9ACTN|nr:hypothetical protein [Nocardiopsis mwathae]MBB6174601.1 hypothetical protein [Nocardiopsis mwathae]
MDCDEEFGRRLLWSVDVKGFGSADDQRQADIQQALPQVLERAVTRSGLDRETWEINSTGDGELAVLPADTPEPVLVDACVRELAVALRRYNHDLVPEARLRLRLAIHHGTVVASPRGYRGKGIVAVSRLVDSDVLRRALASSGADLAIIVSQAVFLDTVTQRHTGLGVVDFRCVRVASKEFSEDAWIHVPGHDVHALDLGPAPGSNGPAAEEPPAPSAAPTDRGDRSDQGDRGAAKRAPKAGGGPRHAKRYRAEHVVHNEFNDQVDASNGVIGMRFE